MAQQVQSQTATAVENPATTFKMGRIYRVNKWYRNTQENNVSDKGKTKNPEENVWWDAETFETTWAVNTEVTLKKI